MLSITRRIGERLRLRINGVDVWLIVAERRGAASVRLSIDAPRSVVVTREELLEPEEQYHALPHPVGGEKQGVRDE